MIPPLLGSLQPKGVQSIQDLSSYLITDALIDRKYQEPMVVIRTPSKIIHDGNQL
jgi:hypothetical protein